MIANPNRRPKALLFANTDWYLYNFRLSLIKKLAAEGWEIVLVSPSGKYAERLQSLGYRWVPFEFSRRSANPLREALVLARLSALYKRERPDLVHQFTIKCVLYGTLAARLIGGISIVNSITGLGFVFADSQFRTRLIRPVVQALYWLAFSSDNVRVVFQNSSDRDKLVRFGLVPEAITCVIRGSGLDAKRFAPNKNGSNGRNGSAPRVLLATRMLRNKGVFELLEAAKIVKRRGLAVEFLVAGDIYPDNPESLTARDIEKIKRSGLVKYLGHVEDMPTLLNNCDIVVSPTYYPEGTPRILIEAAATEKPVIATDIPASEGLVRHGVNGLKIPVKDAQALADAIETLVRQPELWKRFGKNGRAIVLNGFSDSTVLSKTLDVYHNVLPSSATYEADPAARVAAGAF